MAAILGACLRHATDEFKMAQSTKENDGLIWLGDVMRGNAIIGVTGTLARENLEERLKFEQHPDVPESLRTAHKILKLLSEQASFLPQEPLRNENCSMGQYEAILREISEMAKEGSAAQVRGLLKDFASSSLAYPRTDGEIQRMIRCKKETQYLTAVMDVCLDVEALYNPQPEIKDGEIVLPGPPSLSRIDRLKRRLQELDRPGRQQRAVETAQEQLRVMEQAAPKPKPLFADLHPQLVEPVPQPIRVEKQSTWSGRTWVCLGAAACLAIALGILYRGQ